MSNLGLFRVLQLSLWCNTITEGFTFRKLKTLSWQCGRGRAWSRGMDLFGPLERSMRGCCFMLVLVEYMISGSHASVQHSISVLWRRSSILSLKSGSWLTRVLRLCHRHYSIHAGARTSIPAVIRGTQLQEFAPGDEVLVSLPTSSSNDPLRSHTESATMRSDEWIEEMYCKYTTSISWNHGQRRFLWLGWWWFLRDSPRPTVKTTSHRPREHRLPGCKRNILMCFCPKRSHGPLRAAHWDSARWGCTQQPIPVTWAHTWTQGSTWG